MVKRRLLSVLLFIAAVAGTASAHPMHTSLAQITYSSSTNAAVISIRVFADDFAAQVTGTRIKSGAVPIPPEADIQRYIAARFALIAPSGSSVAMSWCGARITADAFLLCFKVPMLTEPATFRIRNTLMTELFEDQVNIVQVIEGKARRTIIFTRGDAVKPLR